MLIVWSWHQGQVLSAPWAFPCWPACLKVTLMRPSPVTMASAEPVPVVRCYIWHIFLGAGGWKAEMVRLSHQLPYFQTQWPHLPQAPWTNPEIQNFFFFSFSCATPYSMENLSSLTRDQTHAPCIGSGESELLDHQGSPRSRAFNLLPLPIAI